jgi:dolichol kinase
MGLVRLLFLCGVVAACLCGFLCPWWYLGFLPLSAGLIWAAYDLTEVTVAEPPPDKT